MARPGKVEVFFVTDVIFAEKDSRDAVGVLDAVCAFPTAGDSAESAATRIRLARMEKITRRELLIVGTLLLCIFDRAFSLGRRVTILTAKVNGAGNFFPVLRLREL